MLPNILASSIVLAGFLVIATIIYYLLNYKNLKKRKEHFENIHQNLKKGKKIEFCGGLYGRILKVNGDFLEIELLDNSKIEISRYVVTRIMD